MAATTVARRSPRALDRAVAFFLLALMAAGSLAMWTVVPYLALRYGIDLLDSQALQLVGGLLLVPLSIGLFSMLLFWLNGLYLRVTGHWGYDADEDRPQRLRGPLEPLLVWSLLAALVLMTYWFFFLADGPGHLGP
jgi:uncharacterized membrane protein